MKSVMFIAAFVISVFTVNKVHAQVNVNINIAQQPVWGPTGYDHVDYYYLPDIDIYYNVPKHQYVYLQDNKWVFRKSLPAKYKNYDFYKGYKVVVNEDKPYLHLDEHRKEYASFRNRHDQQVIRDSRDNRYYVNKKHPEHKNWEKEQKGNNGTH